MNTLQAFLMEWEEGYREESHSIALFDPKLAGHLSREQKELFARTFYHARGKFYKFLWYIGSFAPSEGYKDVILANIREEFGGKGRSHEELIFEFGNALGITLLEETLTDRTNLPFIEQYNQGHIQWLLTHEWDERWSAFAAYERLDNVDYENLYRLVQGFGLPESTLLFYEVHRKIEHYEKAAPLLEKVWQRKPEAVQAGFSFIGTHQLKLWKNLSQTVFS